jgi:uncharacterized membrane protein
MLYLYEIILMIVGALIAILTMVFGTIALGCGPF